jgi:hypothetical protein
MHVLERRGPFAIAARSVRGGYAGGRAREVLVAIACVIEGALTYPAGFASPARGSAVSSPLPTRVPGSAPTT